MFSKIATVVARYGNTDSFSFEKWFNSPYYPTPTIIDAAIQAYATHDISEIANSEAGQDDIRKCENEIETIINYAEHEQKKCICFVTGVPGAGKTLVGLDTVAHSRKQHLMDPGEIKQSYFDI